MMLAIGSDHRGFDLKNALMQQMSDYQWLDVGAYDKNRSDYPNYARKVCDAVLNKEVERGVLLCGSGIGMSIAANRVRGIYAALCWDEAVAKTARQHDGANVLILPSDFVTIEQAMRILRAWFSVTFEEGRYQERLDTLETLSACCVGNTEQCSCR